MRFNVAFNQLELIKYNKGKPKGKTLSLIDAIILQQLYWLSEWTEIETIKKNDGVYFWAAYGKIIDELPALGIESKNGLAKRISRNLIKPGLLKKHIEWSDNSKTYWQFTQVGLKIATPGRPNESTRTTEREAPGRTDERHPDERENNYSSIYNSTNDERELSHIDFLNKYNSKDMQEWQKENAKKIINKDQFKDGFNNDMLERGAKKDSRLIYTFKKYARHWINNQKESDKPQPKLPYMKKIS